MPESERSRVVWPRILVVGVLVILVASTSVVPFTPRSHESSRAPSGLAPTKLDRGPAGLGSPSPLVQSALPAAPMATPVGGVNSMVAKVPVASSPEGICYDSGNGELFVADYSSSAVSILSGATNSVVATLPVGTDPYGVACDSSNGNVYVANSGSNNVSVLLGTLNREYQTVYRVGPSPYAIAFDSGNGDLYVTNLGASNVTVISGATDSIVATVPVGNGPDAVGYDRGNGDVYVANLLSSNVTVISGALNTVVANIPVGSLPQGVAYDSATGNIFVTSEGTSDVSVISGTTNTVVATVPAGNSPDGVAYDRDNGEVYVVNVNGGSPSNLTVISGATNAVIGSVPAGYGATGVACDDGNGDVYVANAGEQTVTVLAGGFNVRFAETGLPVGTGWSAVFDGVSASSSGATLDFIALGGSYTYQVVAGAGYSVSPSSGTAIVTGSFLIAVEFTSTGVPTFTVWVNETGLPSGTSWSAVVAGSEESTTGSSLAFSVPAGTWAFQVPSVPGYTASPSSGLATVAGTYLLAVEFSSTAVPTFTVWVNETGLPAGTAWSAVVAGAEQTTTTGSLAFRVPAGTWAFQVLPVAGYAVSPSGGTATVEQNYLIVAGFTASSPASSPAPTVSVGGYSEGLTIAAAVAATALGFGVAAVLLQRRARPPAPGTPPGGSN